MTYSNNLSAKKLTYCPEIDGLRAISVLAVVGFHAFPNYIKGGFIGVDIFFVISGYLISLIIFNDLNNNIFNFKEFYFRRIRRIFPALIIVLSSCYIFGWFFLTASEFKELGNHIFGGTIFASNFFLWNESGYFDTAANTKVLLHLWSLGIEEQFYIFWPLLLWLIWRTKFNFLLTIIFLIIISFTLNLKSIILDPVGTFYSPLTRIWELMLGGLLAWANINFLNKYIFNVNKINCFTDFDLKRDSKISAYSLLANTFSFFGLMMLVVGFFFIDKSFSYPGYWALLPVFGSLMVLCGGSKSFLNQFFLSNKIIVWIGLISFPLYLWHWPILAFVTIMEAGSPNGYIRLAAIAISFLFAWLTYWLVEIPIRSSGNGKEKVIVLVFLTAIVGYLGHHTYNQDGLPSRQNVNFKQFIGGGY